VHWLSDGSVQLFEQSGVKQGNPITATQMATHAAKLARNYEPVKDARILEQFAPDGLGRDAASTEKNKADKKDKEDTSMRAEYGANASPTDRVVGEFILSVLSGQVLSLEADKQARMESAVTLLAEEDFEDKLTKGWALRHNTPAAKLDEPVAKVVNEVNRLVAENTKANKKTTPQEGWGRVRRIPGIETWAWSGYVTYQTVRKMTSQALDKVNKKKSESC
jgi:hypothetical protein